MYNIVILQRADLIVKQQSTSNPIIMANTILRSLHASVGILSNNVLSADKHKKRYDEMIL